MEEEPIKVVITFNLPEHKDDLQFALDGAKWWGVVWDLDQHLRGQIKHGDFPEGIADKLQEVRDYLRDSIHSNGLTLEQ